MPDSIQNPELKTKKFGKYTSKQVLLAVIFAVITAGLIVSVVGGIYFFSNDRELPLSGNNLVIGNKKANGKWVGIIATTQGLIKVNLENRENLSQPFLPPGFTAEFFKSLTSYDDNGREMFMSLLEDGRLVFRGSEEITTAPNPSTLYYWNISSTENPTSLVEIEKGANLQSFAFSPDSKLVAIISTTVSEELPDNLANDSQKELKKILNDLEEKLQEELRTISIYDAETSKLVRTLKLDLLKSPSRRTRTGKLLWNKFGLFALSQFAGIRVVNPETGDVVENIPDSSEDILISPDGSKYYNIKKLEVRSVSGNRLLARLNAPEFVAPEQIDSKGNLKEQIIFVGPSAFSADSKKLLQQGGSVDLTNFIVWELDIESDSSKKLGDKDSLLPSNASKQNFSGEPGTGFYFTFIEYPPLGKTVIFSVFYAEGLGNNIVDIFQISSDAVEAQLIQQPLKAFNLRDISFLGWYNSN